MCHPLFQRGSSVIQPYKQGAAGNVIVLQPTKTAMTFCDIGSGRRVNVPANHRIIPILLVAPTGLGSCRSSSRLVMACSKKYFLQTHHFAFIVHD